ncbi:MAG: ATP-binding protein [Rubrimonas sp.]|uniref:ATP-binding protein n=1 Tax=Rubrimonas sp. TaxID=2036015 RepID=UPI002FDE71D1
MTRTISRSFIRARHGVALAAVTALCLFALGGALAEARAYHAVVGLYRAAERLQQRVVDVGAAAATRAQTPGPYTDLGLQSAVESLEAAAPSFLDALRNADSELSGLLAPPADLARDFAAFAELGRALAAPAPPGAANPIPDPRLGVMLTLSRTAIRPFFLEVSDRLAARHEALWTRSTTLAATGLIGVAGGLALIGAFVLRPMEKRILEAQEALAVETARAQAAERDKGAMLAQTSHEIRTSLNGVIGMAELLARTELAPQQAGYLDVMRASGAALLRIIDDVLDFSKIAAGEMSFERRRFDPAAVLEATAGLFEPGLRAKGLWLRVEIAPEFPREALGDAVRLRQAVSNILSNASKYTVAGGVTLRAVAEPATGMARIEIEDTGAGIPPDKLDAVFESYRQLETTVADQTRGTGLGLALTRSMVERMGGSVGVASALGRGSTFRIALPLPPPVPARKLAEMRVAVLSADVALTARLAAALDRFGCRVRGVGGATPPSDAALIDARDPGAGAYARSVRQASPTARVVALVDAAGARRPVWADATAQRDASVEAIATALRPDEEAQTMNVDGADAGDAAREAAGLAAAVASGRRPLVLIADDNDVNRMIAETLLRQLGCEVVAVRDGAAALREAQIRAPALILMDVSMPVMNGLDATRAIRRHELAHGRRTPIVALTAHALEEHLDHCLSAGMDARLVKPFKPRDLARVVAHFLAPATATAETDQAEAG